MDNHFEVALSQDKFAYISKLNDLLSLINDTKYSIYGSFLSSALFKRQFYNTFDLLVEDETSFFEIASELCTIDRKKGTMAINSIGADTPEFKIKIYDSVSKNSGLRNYILENTSLETVVLTNSAGQLDKIEIKIPRRGAVLIHDLIELDDSDDQNKVIAVEKIIWSLSQIGVATLLRDVRYMPNDLITQAADKIDKIMVVHANKTASLLKQHGSAMFKTITASELKKFGKPYSILLKA